EVAPQWQLGTAARPLTSALGDIVTCRAGSAAPPAFIPVRLLQAGKSDVHRAGRLLLVAADGPPNTRLLDVLRARRQQRLPTQRQAPVGFGSSSAVRCSLVTRNRVAQHPRQLVAGLGCPTRSHELGAAERLGLGLHFA